MPQAELLGLGGAFIAGAVFVVVAAWPRRAAVGDLPPDLGAPPEDIYWPLLLGTGERSFEPSMRLRIIIELGRRGEEWCVPVLLCAREQEHDPALLAAIDRALGPVGRPVFAPPPAR